MKHTIMCQDYVTLTRNVSPLSCLLSDKVSELVTVAK